MYSDSDLESAITAGALTPEAASALRAHVAAGRASPMVDEENFRLLTGFNDIFVTIAGILLLVGAAWIGQELHPALGAAFVAAMSWGLAEYFTRIRRMALPSILFLLGFVGGCFGTAAGLLMLYSTHSDQVGAFLMAVCCAVAVAAAVAHWRRFHVPITIAAGAAALVGLTVGLLVAIIPGLEQVMYPLILLLGIAVFLFAMRWDMQDPERTTRKSDVAFWLHLLSAPLIAHPVFQMLGLLDGLGASMGRALAVVALYVGMGIVALAIDRRALLVSALAYVVAAIISLFQQFGAVSLNVALAIFVIGSALLLLSAFWQNARARVFEWLPQNLTARLPPIGRTAPIPQPAS
jgi:hypothetical protein